MNEDKSIKGKVTFTSCYDADGKRIDFKGFIKTGEVTYYDDEFPSANGDVRVALVK